MKFGVREICDVVLKTKSNQLIGNKIFYKNEPVIYFDTLKSSGMEGSATTVYAQGGRGNARLMAWEGERTVTFTMEDALISPEGFMILSGAGLIEASEKASIKQHMTQTVDKADLLKANPTASTTGTDGSVTVDFTQLTSMIVPLNYMPYFGDKSEDLVYVFIMKNGEIISEPFLAHTSDKDCNGGANVLIAGFTRADAATTEYSPSDLKTLLNDFDSVMVDYYTERKAGAKQIEITPDKFGGNYYLEASTLFRDTNGKDMPAEFIIPNCKIQSNFNFTMASSGDPSTFTFTMDAFPDYTRFDHSKKVLAAIQIIDDDTVANDGVSADAVRTHTNHTATTPSGGEGSGEGEDS